MKRLSVLKINCLLVLLTVSTYVLAQNITTPRTPSPAASVSQTIGISTITVNYSRPSVKGREIWGSLVPYGWNVQEFGTSRPAPWRAGANENTVIRFSHPATVEGKPVPAGEYGLFFTINKDNTGEVILSKDSRSWGNFFYDDANDQLRAPVHLRSIENTELLTYEFINLSKNSVELVLNWEKKQFPVKIAFAVDDIVMANIAQELKGAQGFNWQAYVAGANYALQNKTNLEQGLKWIDHAIELNNSFATKSVRSALLEAMGRTAEAEKLVNDAMATATEAEINAYGYQVMGTGNTDKAIGVFIMNTTRFPKSANSWDSLGEAYYTKGDKKNAIESFKKSLGLNPNPGTKANSEKYLKLLEGK